MCDREHGKAMEKGQGEGDGENGQTQELTERWCDRETERYITRCKKGMLGRRIYMNRKHGAKS